MKKIPISTNCRRMPADIFTPVGIYLRLRDRFRDTLLLESTDHHTAENSYSFICVNAIAGIEILGVDRLEFKLPGQEPERHEFSVKEDVTQLLWNFMNRFDAQPSENKNASFAQGLYGYTSYDAVRFFEPTIPVAGNTEEVFTIPPIRYRLYQYVIVINHFRDELFICENNIKGLESEGSLLDSLIRNRDLPVFPFLAIGEELPSISDDTYFDMVKLGIASCMRGDTFQIVLSRRFSQSFSGDEFNVYRSLRSINPSSYLFYFDYGDYKIMGSSPESQLVISKGKAVLHPIAGTFKRSGDDETDRMETVRLMNDKKENAEHVMLVDLARNDLSRVCHDVEVTQFRQVQYYSHVIHLVSEVSGTIPPGSNPFELFAKTFPAGTLSGAPKIKAMELIGKYEKQPREYYGGAIGFIGFDGSCNLAIMIRTLLSRNNTLIYQAGAGVVAASDPETELQEVNNKLKALKQSIIMAQTI